MNTRCHFELRTGFSELARILCQGGHAVDAVLFQRALVLHGQQRDAHTVAKWLGYDNAVSSSTRK